MTSQNRTGQEPTEINFDERFTDAELVSIVEQGMIYMCACPAQVAEEVRRLRKLVKYQQLCLVDPTSDSAVHTAIAKSTAQAHAILQDCLDTVIALENWDRATLQMPENLRKRQMQELLSDD